MGREGGIEDGYVILFEKKSVISMLMYFRIRTNIL